MNNIKKEIKEQFEKVKFLKNQDEKLIGYAEMFGRECIPLYNGINCNLFDYPGDVIKNIEFLNPEARKADGFENTLVGHLKLENGTTICLHDKNAIIEQLKQEYMQDKTGLFNGEDDCEESAIEYYYYNIIGAYMDGIPAFAVLYSK